MRRKALVAFFPALVVLVVLGYGCYRAAGFATRRQPAWRVPLAVALSPLLIALAAPLPPLESYKWLWPWTSLAGRIIEFQAATDRAADRLGIPTGRALTPAEIEAWSLATPLRLHLAYPIIGKEVTVSVLDPWSPKRYATGLVVTILSAGD